MPEEPSANLGRIPSLDGWRALSIVLVLGYHSSLTQEFPVKWLPLLKWLFDGNLGVRCFFLISGLLITWLLLREACLKQTINFKHFYVRRAIRILPVYGAFLIVVVMLSFLTPFTQNRGNWIRNLTFTTNFGELNWTTGHLWSLAVEEQFYLIWPAGLALLLRSRCRQRVHILLFMAVAASAAISRVIGYKMHHDLSKSVLLSPFSFFDYWDSIAVGCFLAFVITQRSKWLTIFTTRFSACLIVGLLLIAIPYILERFFLFGIFTIPFGPQFEAAGLAVLILQSIAHPNRSIYRLLNVSVVKSLGVLSYSIYIWQQIFCTNYRALGMGNVWWLHFPLWLVPVLLTSLLSYYGLELPLVNVRRRFRDAARPV